MHALERQLLEILIAEPSLVEIAAKTIRPELLQHSGLRRILEALYTLDAAGHAPDILIEGLGVLLLDRPDLIEAVGMLGAAGKEMTDRPAWLSRIAERINDPEFERKAIQAQLEAGSMDEVEALALLAKLQHKPTVDPELMAEFRRYRLLPVQPKNADRNIEYQPSLETYAAFGMFNEVTCRFIDGTEATNTELYPGDEQAEA